MLELYVRFTNWLQEITEREEGQDLAEYALLIGLIAIAVVLAVTFLGSQISLVFSRIGSAVASWTVPT